MTSKPRAVAVVRVSAQGERPEEHFHSPDVQLDSAKRWARKRRERFVAHFPEIDVSDKRPLVKRPGLLKAVEFTLDRRRCRKVADRGRLAQSSPRTPC